MSMIGLFTATPRAATPTATTEDKDAASSFGSALTQALAGLGQTQKGSTPNDAAAAELTVSADSQAPAEENTTGETDLAETGWGTGWADAPETNELGDSETQTDPSLVNSAPLGGSAPSEGEASSSTPSGDVLLGEGELAGVAPAVPNPDSASTKPGDGAVAEASDVVPSDITVTDLVPEDTTPVGAGVAAQDSTTASAAATSVTAPTQGQPSDTHARGEGESRPAGGATATVTAAPINPQGDGSLKEGTAQDRAHQEGNRSDAGKTAATPGGAGDRPAVVTAPPVVAGAERVGVAAVSAPTATPEASQAAPVTGVSAPAPTAATAPAAAAAPPAPAMPFATQLARPIFSLAAAGRGEHVMTISVTPDTLGPVTVRAHVGADGVRVELFAPSDLGREAIRNIMPELRRDLAGAGLGGSLNLSSQNQPSSQSGGDQAAGQGMAGGRESATHGKTNPNSASTDEPGDADAHAAAQNHQGQQALLETNTTIDVMA